MTHIFITRVNTSQKCENNEFKDHICSHFDVGIILQTHRDKVRQTMSRLVICIKFIKEYFKTF